MRQRFEIPGRFPGLNEFYRFSPQKQARVKSECDELVAWCAKAARLTPYSAPVRYRCTWVEQNRRRDLDNIAFAKKFIQDGLVKAGIIRNDTHHEISGFEDAFAYDSQNPRVIVEIWEER